APLATSFAISAAVSRFSLTRFVVAMMLLLSFEETPHRKSSQKAMKCLRGTNRVVAQVPCRAVAPEGGPIETVCHGCVLAEGAGEVHTSSATPASGKSCAIVSMSFAGMAGKVYRFQVGNCSLFAEMDCGGLSPGIAWRKVPACRRHHV